MARKDPERRARGSCGRIQHVALAEIGGRQEIEVEAGLADEVCRKGLLQMDGNAEALAFRRDLQAIAETEVGISRGADDLVGRRTTLARGELRDGVPLLRSRLQTDLPIRSDTLAVLNDLDTPQLLIAKDGVEEILVSDDAQTLALEVIQVIEMEVSSVDRQGPDETTAQQRPRYRKHPGGEFGSHEDTFVGRKP